MILLPFSIPFYLKWRHTQISSIYWLTPQGLDQLKLGHGSSTWVAHMGSRIPGIVAIISCLAGYFVHYQEAALTCKLVVNPGTLIQNVGIPNSRLIDKNLLTDHYFGPSLASPDAVVTSCCEAWSTLITSFKPPLFYQCGPQECLHVSSVFPGVALMLHATQALSVLWWKVAFRSVVEVAAKNLQISPTPF